MFKFMCWHKHGRVVVAIMALLSVPNVVAWSEHNLITYPLLQTLPEVSEQTPVKVDAFKRGSPRMVKPGFGQD